MSCVDWAPKSRIRMRCAGISGLGAAPSLAATTSRSGDPVIRRLLRDRHIMHVALAHAGGGDAYEPRSGTHLLDTIAAGVSHRRAQAAGQLIQDRNSTRLNSS